MASNYWWGILGLSLLWPAAAYPEDGPAAAQEDVKPAKSWWLDSPWGDPERGFHWYPDPVQKKPEQRKPEEAQPKPKQKTIYEMTTLDDIQQELKRLKGAAILNPTEQNIYEHLKAQAWVMDKSAIFADMSRRVVWANPDVNYNARSPVANAARLAATMRQGQETQDTLKDLAQQHAIFFFAKSDCPYCHDQAPILKGFVRATGMPVMAISMDGAPIPGFPDARSDNGISMLVSGGMGIQTVPAVYLVNRHTKQAIPLGAGVVAADELAERIRILVKTQPGQEF